MSRFELCDVDDDIKSKIERKSDDLFGSKSGKPQLQVVRVYRSELPEEKDVLCVVGNRDVDNRSQLEVSRQVRIRINLSMHRCKAVANKWPEIQELNSISEIFFIRQDRSWTTLNISRELFEDFLGIYKVFPLLWSCLFTFGRKSEENEFEFPPLQAYRTPSRQLGQPETYGK
jgi:hypothetical protein